MSRLSDYIESLSLRQDETHRGNCPECGGRNTFTATRSLGNILYNCYKNSCRIAGAVSKDMDAHAIKAMMDGRSTSQSYSEQDLCGYSIPPYLIPYAEVEYPLDPTFLRRYDINPDDVMYDIRQDRVVFIVRTENNVVVDAVGRSMTNRKPKWLRYASSPVPFVHGVGVIGVVVEDAISAYVIGEYFQEVTGIALLGTQLTDFHRWYIDKWFDKVIVALDADAIDKTVEVARRLNAKALKLHSDLKYRKTEDLDNLAEMLYGYN